MKTTEIASWLVHNGEVSVAVHSPDVKNSTVEPQSYGLHSYEILSQPDTDIEYIFGKYSKVL